MKKVRLVHRRRLFKFAEGKCPRCGHGSVRIFEYTHCANCHLMRDYTVKEKKQK